MVRYLNKKSEVLPRVLSLSIQPSILSLTQIRVFEIALVY